MMKHVLALASLTWLVIGVLVFIGKLDVPDNRMIMALVSINGAAMAAHFSKDKH
jgi:hypothetical protein